MTLPALRRLCGQLSFCSNALGVMLLDEDGRELMRAGNVERLERAQTHITLVASQAILVVAYDGRTTLELVRKRVRELKPRFERLLESSASVSAPVPIAPPQRSSLRS